MCVHVERVMYVHVERVMLCLYTKSVNVYADGIMNEGEKLSLASIISRRPSPFLWNSQRGGISVS